MWKIIVYFSFFCLAVMILRDCNDTSDDEIFRENAKSDSVKSMLDDIIMKENKIFFDSLNVIYQKKGYPKIGRAHV